MKKEVAIIIGAGPAGLTAAYELLQNTDIKPVIYEMSGDIGGISKTVNYKGNRIDIGGHRFFSKSDKIMQWWLNILPLQGKNGNHDVDLEISYQNKRKNITVLTEGPDPQCPDKVMLLRPRLSRIYFLRKFFDYPVSLSFQTIKNLGLSRVFLIGISYVKSCILPIINERNLEEFFINRFGRRLYATFFKDYTEKVWGVPCEKIPAEWGAQRIKGLSITKAILHSVKTLFLKNDSVSQKEVETSLIEQFLYPKLGPGQMWEEVADVVRKKGGEVSLNRKIVGLDYENNKITAVKVLDCLTGEISTHRGDYYFSTMPIKDLIDCLEEPVPQEVKDISQGLMYRDFITVGLLLNQLKIKNETKISTWKNIVPDNWIYIQERDVRVGRLQIFNNWSPYMVKDKDKVWIGLEYFCNEGDDLWGMPDDVFINFAIDELVKIEIIEKEDVIDKTIIRVPKTYPAYFGTYDKFDIIRNFTDNFENLFLIGRNGMHKYNNQDHSMLTAMAAVENIVSKKLTKDNIWSVNAEGEYHEER